MPPCRLITALVVLAPAFQGAIAQTAPSPAPEGFAAPFRARLPGTGAIKVGPERGTLVVVGGGALGPEIYQAFIAAAGGPDALILIVPNASGADSVSPNTGQAWRANGARNVQPLFTRDRRVADSDSFADLIGRAGGVWFEGGRQYRLVQDYGGTRAEREFRAVLERGGVVGGSSAGATILGDFMVRGAPSNNNAIMDFPGYQTAFGYLRGVAIDQHVVARSRLPDLADSIITRYPGLLGISEDEGTAWVIRGDTGRIIGRGKAFVYNGRDRNDPESPFLTLHPGDAYDLHARRVLRRVRDRSPVGPDLVRSLFARYEDPTAGGATLLVAQAGEVFIAEAFGIPAQPRYMPRTSVPLFDIGDMAKTFTELCAQLPAPANRGRGAGDTTAATAGRARAGAAPSPLQMCVSRIASPIGAHQTVTPDSMRIQSNVDELYRFALGLQVPGTWRNADYTKGWILDTYRDAVRLAAYGTADGKRAAMVRLPELKATVIILTNDPAADARAMSERILDRLLAAR